MDGKIEEKVKRLNPTPYLRGATGRAERESLWPSLSDEAPYKAAGDPDNGEVPRLVVMMGKDGFKAGATAYHIFQYVHLDHGEFGFTADGEQWFAFLFSGKLPRRLMIQGRNLKRTCDYIALRRMPWIRLADRDFGPGDGVPDDEPVITRLSVDEWSEEEE